MTGEMTQVPDLAPDDVIHISHQHAAGTRCGHPWTLDVAVERIRRAGAHLVAGDSGEPALLVVLYAVDWRETPQMLGGRAAVSGTSVLPATSQVLRIGHLRSRAAA